MVISASLRSEDVAHLVCMNQVQQPRVGSKRHEANTSASSSAKYFGKVEYASANGAFCSGRCHGNKMCPSCARG